MPSVIIIGAGFGGLGIAIELQRNGFREFTILEKAADLGGVWRENTYPGAACDVPSPLYSFAHEPKPKWRQRYSTREDIWEYMRGVARRHGLFDSIVFGAEVTEAEFDTGTGRWTVRTADGVARTADVLVPAVGQLSRPAMPSIPGIGLFAGESFHSAQWNHEVELTGKRVACIGTGASAIQYVPEIQPKAGHLTVFQRTAPWVLPKFDTDYKPIHQRILIEIPGMPVAERFSWWILGEFVALGLVEFPGIVRMVSRMAEKHLEEQVTDPVLRAKLTPDYPIGCKRGLFSSDFYPALCEPNVSVETTPITEIVPEGIRTADGVLHEADVIIYGTGFKGTEFLWPMKIRGRGGHNLGDVWSDGAHAYLGISVPEFPNMFMIYGPNTNLGVGSIIYMIESQARYIRHAVQLLAERPGTCLEVRPDIERDFNDALQKRLARTPWNFCTSWYRTASGRITNNWPGITRSYRRRTRKLRLSDYLRTPAATP
ncbi:flavin-containing monooxygenase [Nocardia seriolae]|uniref:Cyclohexanone monooxygenase n=1 Tax=Nocardia seriolae TaxID=37332 RepID=A0ABC8B6A9_9NOCA|nr:NAD(P)/FAD-dependent oxidoreductase [Nocardia seriolae]APB01755.1 Cyclohexanone monooxygenase [Nocardia seriolae]MTJ60789.1 NAD(P)-binding protein [Nocardia seriolae]MTJ70274.1 NAD(P)-binding protein [Nocardia seriolae]MTJ91068.1 NAD(P)-binding protein [Nocardia seriolae]MTK35030.1 NAD(P)-binding protein [Nocardia seriolae]